MSVNGVAAKGWTHQRPSANEYRTICLPRCGPATCPRMTPVVLLPPKLAAGTSRNVIDGRRQHPAVAARIVASRKHGMDIRASFSALLVAGMKLLTVQGS